MELRSSSLYFKKQNFENKKHRPAAIIIVPTEKLPLVPTTTRKKTMPKVHNPAEQLKSVLKIHSCISYIIKTNSLYATVACNCDKCTQRTQS